MLSALTIKNFAIIDELEITFAPGLNVLTGETGAGKSIIIDAVGLLLGGRADSVFIREGCETALLEGVFLIDDALHSVLHSILDQEALDNTERAELVLCRELRSNGRNACRVNGRTVNLSLLCKIGRYLVDIHGQSEHISLLQSRNHQDLLDRYAGLTDQRSAYTERVRKLHSVRSEIGKLVGEESSAARSVDLLNFQVQEVNAAELHLGEEELLFEERNRLANAAKIAELIEEAIQATSEGIDHEGGTQPSASDLLGNSSEALVRLAQIDSSLMDTHQLCRSLAEQVTDLGRDLQNYQDKIEINPKRLMQVEERLELIHNLKRKYGNSISDVIASCTRAQLELDQITHVEERISGLREQEQELLEHVGELGSSLSQSRRSAGTCLSQEVIAELRDLHMERAQFKVEVVWQDDKEGAFVTNSHRVAFGTTGLDKIEFLVAPNPGEGFKPIAQIASGGEMSRLMLAIKSVLAHADDTPTLIFDEIDQGIGGRLGAIVGYKLWRLTNMHQVLCITHLPQLAGYGCTHFRVDKYIDKKRTRARISQLNYSERVDELAHMLGMEGDSIWQGAGEILEKAAAEKALVASA